MSQQTGSNLAEGGLVVESGAAVSVPTCPDLEVEGTVDPEVGKMMRTNWKNNSEPRRNSLVLLCAED